MAESDFRLSLLVIGSCGDTGGRGSLDVGSTTIKPFFRSLSTPAWPARKRDCDQRRWGYRVNKTDHRKIIAAGPIPPTAGEERDSGKRTIGVDDHHGAQVEMPVAKKLSLQDLYPRMARLKAASDRVPMLVSGSGVILVE